MAKPADKTQTSLTNVRFSKRNVLGLVIFLLALYAVLPQISKFKASFDVIQDSDIHFLLLALVFALLTTFIASATYLLLAKKRLKYSRTLSIQFASLFTSKLLPAGLGTLGLNFEYLRKNRHSRPQAGAVVATNNLMGLLGHIILLGLVILLTDVSLSQTLHLHVAKPFIWTAIVVLVLLFAAAFWFKKLRHEIFNFLSGSVRDILDYSSHPLRLLGALGTSMLLTTCYALCLLACAWVVGWQLPFGKILVILTAGVAGSTIAPTPGGLVGAEAGLFAGLVAYGVSAAPALAIVLIYRFITYWLALAFGALGWIYIRRRHYI